MFSDSYFKNSGLIFLCVVFALLFFVLSLIVAYTFSLVNGFSIDIDAISGDFLKTVSENVLLLV